MPGKQVSKRGEMSSGAERHPLSIEAKLRIREELHSVQIGLNLLQQEIISGDLEGADLTYATIQQCMSRLADDELLRMTAVQPDLHASC